MTKTVLVLVFLLLVAILPIIRLAHADTIVQDSWKEVAPMHQARSGLGVIAVDGKIFAIGGTASSGGFISSVLSTNEQYDPVTNTWVYRASMPTARAYFAIAAYDNKIYCFGGMTGMRSADDVILGFYTSNDVNVVEEYDIITDTWTTKAHMPKGGGMYMSAQEVNGLIYVFKSPYVYVYNPLNDTWTERDKVPILSYSALIDGKIFSTNSQDAGYEPNSTNYGRANTIQQVVTYDPITNQLTTGSNASPGVDAGNAAATSGKYAPKRLYVMGVKSATAPSLPINQAYDPITDSWTTAKAMPTTRTNFGIAVINDTLYAIGGILTSYNYDSTGKYIVSADTTPTNINEQYIPIGYGTIQPQITIISPQKTYSSSTIPLNFLVDKPFVELSYSLDGKDNITVMGNTTITNLVDGNHTLTIYVKDSFGNIGNQTINFTVYNQPNPIMIIAVPIAAAFLVAGLLLYRRHWKTTQFKN